MNTVRLHYAQIIPGHKGIIPGYAKHIVLTCEHCGEEIELVKDGKINGGKCMNPQCPMNINDISVEFGHVETTRRYGKQKLT